MKKDFGILFWFHLFLIIIAYFSPIWFDWKIVCAGIVVLEIYYYFRGGCDVTFLELGKDEDITFAWYYLVKIFPKLHKRKTKFFLDYILPVILIISSFVSQVIYSYQPFIKF
jgi:hypothetical protein